MFAHPKICWMVVTAFCFVLKEEKRKWASLLFLLLTSFPPPFKQSVLSSPAQLSVPIDTVLHHKFRPRDLQGCNMASIGLALIAYTTFFILLIFFIGGNFYFSYLTSFLFSDYKCTNWLYTRTDLWVS